VLRVNTTVIAIVTTDQTRVKTATARNVSVHSPDGDEPALDRSAMAWAAAKQARTTYFVHDADPLADVATAWADFFDGTAPMGTIEVVREQVLARWRAESVTLPDYYLIDRPEDLPTTLRHWYLGILAGAAVQRVVAIEPNRSIADHLCTLSSGRWWPTLDTILAGIEHVVPDQLDTPAEATPETRLFTPNRQVTRLDD
jgi:hypothetical protein